MAEAVTLKDSKSHWRLYPTGTIVTNTYQYEILFGVQKSVILDGSRPSKELGLKMALNLFDLQDHGDSVMGVCFSQHARSLATVSLGCKEGWTPTFVYLAFSAFYESYFSSPDCQLFCRCTTSWCGLFGLGHVAATTMGHGTATAEVHGSNLEDLPLRSDLKQEIVLKKLEDLPTLVLLTFLFLWVDALWYTWGILAPGVWRVLSAVGHEDCYDTALGQLEIGINWHAKLIRCKKKVRWMWLSNSCCSHLSWSVGTWRVSNLA